MKLRLLAGIMSLSLACAMPVMAAETPQADSKVPVTATLAAPTSEAKINLNTADEKQLNHAVKGIGEKRAKAIVKYRTEHGAFKSVDDLASVPGLGKKFVEKNHKQLMAKFEL